MMGADQLQLTDRPQWPLAQFKVGKFGAFNAERGNASEGACGSQGYPCTHKGADLGAPAGSVVRVPFSGFVLYHGPADKAPFVGYGPWVALIAHHDRSTPLSKRVWQWVTSKGLADIANFPEDHLSVRYSLIGHLAEPDLASLPDELPLWTTPKPTDAVPRFDLVRDIWDAAKVKPDRKKWRPRQDRPQDVVMMSEADGAANNRMVFAGQQLGHVAASNHPHVHWELRTAPILPGAASRGAWRIDPIETFRQLYEVALPQGAEEPAAPARSGGGGVGILLLAAALAFGGKKKKRAGARR